MEIRREERGSKMTQKTRTSFIDVLSGNGVHKEVTRSFGGNFMLMLGTFFNMKKDGVILVSSNFGVVTEFYSAQ